MPLEAVANLLEKPDYNVVRFFFTLGAVLMLSTIFWKVGTKRWFLPIDIGIILLLGGTLGWIVVKILKTEHYLEGIVIATCSTVTNLSEKPDCNLVRFSFTLAAVPMLGTVFWKVGTKRWFMPINFGIIFLLGGTLGWIVVKILKTESYLEGIVIACSTVFMAVVPSSITFLGGILLDVLKQAVSSSIIWLGGLLLDPLKLQVQYIKDFKENVQCLLREWEKLRSQQKKNQNEVARRWMENVRGLEERVKGIEREFRKNKRCLNGCLPNYYSRLQLSKEAERLIGEVKKLIEEKPFEDADQGEEKPSVNIEDADQGEEKPFEEKPSVNIVDADQGEEKPFEEKPSVNIVDADQVPAAKLTMVEHSKRAAAKEAFKSISRSLAVQAKHKIAKLKIPVKLKIAKLKIPVKPSKLQKYF